MNKYSKILHHISPSTKKPTTSQSSTVKKRTFEEYEEDQNKTEVDRLKEEVNELKKNIQFLENLVVNQYENIEGLKQELKTPQPKVNLQEGLLNEPPNVKNTDPLTPLDQKFVTFAQLSDHYRLFTNRVLEQMATVGGGGETKLKYLDDIVGIATNAGAYNGRFLKYNHSIKKFVFESAGAGSQDLDFTLDLGNTSTLGMSVGVITATNGIFTADASPFNPAVKVSGMVTSDSSNHGLLEVGELGFEDTNIITSFSDEVDGYTQLIVQNKSDGEYASTDIVINNNRPDGGNYYLNLGINSSEFAIDDIFSDPDGSYLFAVGGTLTVGTLDGYDLKFGTNNLVSIRLDRYTAIPYFGTEESTIDLLNPVAVFTYDSPEYSQVQIQNKSNGSNASIDFIASTDTATDVSEYIDLGINCSGFSTDGLWGPKDGYLYVHGPDSGPGGNLVIGTLGEGDIIFHTSTINDEDERLRITNTAVGIGTTNPSSKLTVNGDIKAGFSTSQGLILTAPNGTEYRITVDNVGTLSAVSI